MPKPLFLIYINDLPQAVLGSTVSMYADDTSLRHQSDDITQLKAINNNLRHLGTWLQHNKLSLNTIKQKRNIHQRCKSEFGTKYMGKRAGSSPENEIPLSTN